MFVNVLIQFAFLWGGFVLICEVGNEQKESRNFNTKNRGKISANKNDPKRNHTKTEMYSLVGGMQKGFCRI